MSAVPGQGPLLDEAARRMELNLPLSMGQVAFVLNLTIERGAKRGWPAREQAIALVQSGRLRLVDPSQPVRRWTVSPAELRRYIAGTPLPVPSPLVEVSA